MTKGHKIQNAELKLNFNSPLEAESFEQNAHNWVMNELLPHIEQIFNRYCPPNEVITIDHLSLDLGNLETNSLFSDLLNAIEKQVCEQLNQHIHSEPKNTKKLSPQPSSKSPAEKVSASVTRYSNEDYSWHQALQFLQTGQLPWAFDSKQAIKQTGMIETLLDDPDRLNQTLRQSSRPEPLLTRLVGQLSAEQLTKLLDILSPIFCQNVVIQLLNSPKRHHSKLKAWLAKYWQQRIQDALSHHQLTELDELWYLLIQDYRQPLLAALHTQAQNGKLPSTLMHSLNDTQRFALLKCIEPTEYPFLYALLNTPQLWQATASATAIDSSTSTIKAANDSHSAEPLPAVSETTINQQLWLFTLHYLLIERGSRFNKQQYLMALITQMAAAHNQTQAQLINTLQTSLAFYSLDSTLKRQMASLLATIAQTLTSTKPVLKTPFNIDLTRAEDIHRLMRALLYGEIDAEIAPYIDQLMRQPKSFKGILTFFASTPELKDRLWQRLPRPIIVKILNQLGQNPIDELTDTQQIKQAWHQLLAPASDKTKNKTAPVLTDAFNDLLIILQKGSEANLKHDWPKDKIAFRSLLLWVGQLAAVRQHWAEHYSDPILLDMTHVIEPKALEAVRSVMQEKALFSADLESSQPTKNINDATLRISLWQFTLSFLLVESSNKFNRHRYLLSLTRQMAARRNLGQEQLIQAMILALSPYPQHTLLNTLKQESDTVYTRSSPYNPVIFGPEQNQKIVSILTNNHSEATHTLMQILQQPNSTSWQQQVPQWLQSFISELGQANTIRQRWVANFDDAILLTLVELIDTSATATIEKVMTSHQLISQVLTSQPIQSGSKQTTAIQPTHLRNSLWELTFTYLLVERGSQFNRRSYLASLTSKLAARHNLNHHQFIHALLENSDGQHAWRNDLQQLFRQTTALTEPELLSQLQQDKEAILLTKEQNTQLQTYLSAPSLPQRWAIQQWTSEAQQGLIKTLAPHLWPSLEPLLAGLSHLFNKLRINAHWFYQMLLSQQAPRTMGDWLNLLFDEIKRQQPSKTSAQVFNELRDIIKTAPAHIAKAQEQAWLAGLTDPAEQMDLLVEWLKGNDVQPEATTITHLIQQHPSLLWSQLTHQLQSPQNLLRWINELNEASHFQLIAIHYSHIIGDLMAIHQALKDWLKNESVQEPLFWQVIYHRLLLQGRQGISSVLLQQILSDLTEKPEIKAKLNADSSTSLVSQLSQMLTKTKALPAKDGLISAIQLSEHDTPSIKPSAPKPLNIERKDIRQLYEAIEQTPPKESKTRASNATPWQDPNAEKTEASDPIPIHNAGLVLAATYIPMLFQRLKLTDGQQFFSLEARHQALFCLQWMADSSQEAPEYQLMLNKVLCGIAIHDPVPNTARLPDGAAPLIEGLLNALINHWKAIGSTSIEGLQSTFIQRGGQLISQDKQWQLEVFPGTFDMLLDQLPWSFQTIKYPWMNKPLFVTWR
ncbi:contractile injection system tape measure protein [Marinomonas sp. TI.3.20]|uniref:contractile injection system tape measure protein n=1 Tax=Marinomonas sp. TI.3.20 TaxID=3121296 RepID=UPI00311FC647